MEVSVVLTVYNEERNIEDFLDSLRDQSYKDFELIIIDDGSTDSTLEIIDKYKDKLRIKILQLEHVGRRKALNKGIASSKKGIVITLDADEIIDKSCVKNLVRSFEDPCVGAVGGFVESYGNTWFSRGKNILNKIIFNAEKRRKVTRIWSGCAAYQKGIIEELGGLRVDSVVEDTDISIKIQKAGYKVLLIDEAIVSHKERESIWNIAQKEFERGQESFNFYLVYKDELIHWKPLSRFYPLVFVFLVIYSYELFIIGSILTFIVSQISFRRVKAPSVDKVYAWIALTYINFWWSLGLLNGLRKKANRKMKLQEKKSP